MEIRQPMADVFNLLTLLLSALDTIIEIISKRICTTIEGRFRPSYCLLHLCDGGEFLPYIGLAILLYASLRHVQFAGGEGGVGEAAFVICE